ncbi:metallophosphoesterase family protein [Thermoleophilum album]|uniref:metallophosphoesterase family protein n=1 Tax=Thermoleophilum album TaxID=29539 RepID=UPI00237D2F15|nr:metallophosphoesterase family protein [Thermoleophilum album]WDT94179.1 metallophosphoesterase family protein [Thermoleophilum album]
MRILAFSDIHCDTDRARRLVERAREVDVVVGAGDFARVHRGLEETIAALAAIETPTVLVPGNNETDQALRAACAEWPHAHVLHGEQVELAGRVFFGLGGGIPETPWDWSHDLSEQEAEALLAAMPEGAVLVVHSPPYGHCDDGLGSRAILRAIESKRPPLCVCGHIHQCWGQESRVDGTLVANLGPDGRVFDL